MAFGDSDGAIHLLSDTEEDAMLPFNGLEGKPIDWRGASGDTLDRQDVSFARSVYEVLEANCSHQSSKLDRYAALQYPAAVVLVERLCANTDVLPAACKDPTPGVELDQGQRLDRVRNAPQGVERAS